jgi:hypothetical protein
MRAHADPASFTMSPPINAAPAPVIDSGVDRDGDAGQRHGDEHPAQCVEIQH